ncbi:MAG: LuxR C-terminal-related transcriptional regulator [Thermomicrobiales bacterium]
MALPRSHQFDLGLDVQKRLPSDLTPLVGRELALREIQRQFQQPDLRLLTLVGPGGVGKTRLAIRAAAELASDFDEVVFVDFSPIADSALALSLLARTLGVLEDGEAPLAHRLATAIGNRQLLLVLDNLERILPFGSDVAMLLRSCPGTKALATSRAPLRVSGEQEYLVPPLDLPAAIELFVARARAVRPSISATVENEPVIVAICRELDMLPLAIELAAARAKVLSVDAILARLEHRLALLTGGPQDSPERQRSLRDAIAWSVELLDEADRRRFRSLAVFTGGFTIDAYEYVVEGTLGTGADPLDAIFSLVDKNLVRVLDQPDGDQEIERFGLLETVREYASELLAESDDAAELRNRHAMWCVEFVELAAPMLVNGAAERWARRIDAEFPNLRSALDWLLEQERTDEALRLSSELWTYWMTFGGLGEGRQWLDNALMLPGGTPSLRVRAVGIAGHFASNQGDFAYEAQVQEALTTSRLIGDPVGEAIALYALGDLANEQNDFQRGPEYLEAAIALCDQVGDETRATMAMVNLGSLARRMGDDERAAELIGQTVERARAQQFGVALTFSLNLMSRVARARGDLRTARALYQESLETAWKLGQRVTIAFILLDGAALAAAGDQPERAARLLGAAESLRETIGMPHEPSVSHASGSGYDAVVTKIRVALGEQKFESAWNAGRSLPIEQAVEEAIWDETAQAHATRSQFGLTARELDVLRLLVAGRSDRQIGDALFISPRTAQVHVANILAKLDVPTRGAAAATALRFGVIDDAPLSQ